MIMNKTLGFIFIITIFLYNFQTPRVRYAASREDGEADHYALSTITFSSLGLSLKETESDLIHEIISNERSHRSSMRAGVWRVRAGSRRRFERRHHQRARYRHLPQRQVLQRVSLDLHTAIRRGYRRFSPCP